MINNGINSLSITYLSLQYIDKFKMPPVTEVATLFLKAGTDVQDQSSPQSQIAQEAISTISSQQGFQRIYYGPVLEDASLLQFFIGACPQDFQRKQSALIRLCSKILTLPLCVHLLT